MEGSLYRKNNTCKSIITGPGGKKEFVKSRLTVITRPFRRKKLLSQSIDVSKFYLTNA